KQRFGLSIPVHTVQTLAERAKRHLGYLQRTNATYALTASGRNYIERLETPREVERRLESLLAHACTALSKHNVAFADRSFTLEAITRVVKKNYHVFDFVVEKLSSETHDGAAAVDKDVLNYFAQLERSDPLQFSTLRDLILGSTL